MYGRETNDIYYTSLLPVKKTDTVKAKFLLIILAQMTQLLISLPFAILRLYILPAGNPAGIEANIAYYGFGFIIYAIFDVLFLTEFFKTGYKAGKAFILGIIPASLGVISMEVLVHIPKFSWLDSVLTDTIPKQLPILMLGIIIYMLSIIIAYKISAERFQKVDL